MADVYQLLAEWTKMDAVAASLPEEGDHAFAFHMSGLFEFYREHGPDLRKALEEALEKNRHADYLLLAVPHAYREGFRARRQGESRGNNPHNDGTVRSFENPLAQAWDAGWLLASSREWRRAEIQLLTDQRDAERDKVGRLLGAVNAYLDAPPMVCGEARRELTATAALLEGKIYEGLSWVSVCAKQNERITTLEAEVARLKRGDFTEEEFQGLCHHFSEDDAVRFRKGCEEYQQKLFGRPADKAYAERWLRDYAARWNHYDGPDEAFDRLIEDLKSGHLSRHGSDSYSLGDVDSADELRRQAEAYLGIKIDWDDFGFSCSC